MQSEGYHEKNVLSTLGKNSVVDVIFFFKVILGEELTNPYLLLQNRFPRPDPDTLWAHGFPAVQTCDEVRDETMTEQLPDYHGIVPPGLSHPRNEPQDQPACSFIHSKRHGYHNLRNN